MTVWDNQQVSTLTEEHKNKEGCYQAGKKTLLVDFDSLATHTHCFLSKSTFMKQGSGINIIVDSKEQVACNIRTGKI